MFLLCFLLWYNLYNNMNLKFKVSKPANFFFFIDNLSEWNIYYRKKYNEELIKQFGELTNVEKKALKNFKSIMQKYEKIGISKKIRRCFYQKSDDIKISFRKLDKLLDQKEINILKNSFNTLQPRFEKIWSKYFIVLNYNKKISSSAYEKINKKINLAYLKLESFYGNKSKKIYTCNVFLIISPNRGGKAIRRDAISIEAEKLDPKDKYRFARLWFSIMHEMTHARFENKKYKNWLSKFIEKKTILRSKLIKNRNPKEILREVITDLTKVSLYHILDKEGRIRIERLENKNKVLDLNTMEIMIRKELGSTIEKYFLDKTKINNEFLEKCWDLIEKYS